MSVLDDILDDVNGEGEESELSKASKKFKSTNNFKKDSKSVVKAAKGNIFEFPVFVAKSVPLDYATATVSLLEQVYGSYLQMAISINPVIDADMAKKGTQFNHLRSDTNKYLECVDPTYMPYAVDICHNVFEENGVKCEFNLVNIEDSMAKVINEAVDHQPLSEFDHFFQESAPRDADDPTLQSNASYSTRLFANIYDNNPNLQDLYSMSGYITPHIARCRYMTSAVELLGYNTNTAAALANLPTTAIGTVDWTAVTGGQLGPIFQAIRDDLNDANNHIVQRNPDGQHERNQRESAYRQAAEAHARGEALARSMELSDAQLKDIAEDLANGKTPRYIGTGATRTGMDVKNSAELFKALNDEREAITKLIHASEDRARKVASENASIRKNNADAESKELETQHKKEDRDLEVKQKKLNYEKTALDIMKSTHDLKQSQKKAKWEDEDRKLDRMAKANQARVKTAQWLDETKIQKLNTMKPLMMSVDLNVIDKNGSLSHPVAYVVGVKCHTRLIDPDILPEVAAYPLKEMNNQMRKIKWRAGELKFRELVFKKSAKKQTAIDSKDPKRKWYRRLYELAHSSGDGTAAASIKNGKSPWSNWWKDRLTGGNNKDVDYGLIPNATIVISKSDVDNIKREKGIDLLKGSTAAKFCKELFLIGLVVIDNDAESVKFMMPDLHKDYDVMSLAAINKQIAMLDTAGTKTRDIMKLLG